MAEQKERIDPTTNSCNPPPPLYGTFAPAHSPPPPSATDYPPPPVPAQQAPLTQYHVVHVGYQSHAHPVVAEGVPVILKRENPLPCCGIGIGWALFLAGFFLAAFPWYIGAFILVFVAVDHREKGGLVACTIAAALSAIVAILGMSNHKPL